MAATNKSERKRILIVDDSPEMIEVLGNALPNHYKRQFALSGKKAIDLMRRSEELPDLILLDVLMPGMDGYEVCRQLKEDVRFEKIPIIFLSALTDAKDKVKAFENGGVDYIQKPFEIAEVNVRVELHLKLHHLQAELEKHNRNLNQLVNEKVMEISESQIAMIYALAKLAESRDDDTGLHLQRIQVFCRLIAEKLSSHLIYSDQLSDEFIENLEKVSPLHDIGKVGVRDAVLLKPGKLTREEFEEIKEHVNIGANTLREVFYKFPNNKSIEMGIEITQYHHEKWNGKGYPEGLSGQDIPLSARIMTLVDAYDAIISKRIYKEAISHEEACKIIAEERGEHFDPLIVDVFLEFEEEFRQAHIKLEMAKTTSG
jgi:putative two-component system response regulator